MLRLFNNNQPYQAVLLLLFTLLFNAVLFIQPSAFALHDPTAPISKWLFGLLKMDYRLIAGLSILLVYIQALLLTRLTNEIKLFPKSTFVPGMIFVLVSCMFRDYLFLSPALIANTFIVVVLAQLFAMYKQQYAYLEVYDTGLLIGVSSLIYFPSIILLVAMFVGLSILRPFIWREWIIGLLGLLTVYFLVFTWFFWVDGLGNFIDHQFGSALFGFNSHIPFRMDVQVIGVILLAMLVGTFFIFQNSYLKSPIQIRKYLILTIWALLLLVVSFLFEYAISLGHFLIISVPLSLILAYYLLNIKSKRVAEIVYWVYMLSILFFQFYPTLKK